jgi:hypothetical protein
MRRYEIMGFALRGGEKGDGCTALYCTTVAAQGEGRVIGSGHSRCLSSHRLIRFYNITLLSAIHCAGCNRKRLLFHHYHVCINTSQLGGLLVFPHERAGVPTRIPNPKCRPCVPSCILGRTPISHPISHPIQTPVLFIPVRVHIQFPSN